MPWHIEDNHPSCDGYAVVKDDDNELEGCHRTRTQAEAQLAALNIAEDEDDEDDDEDDDLEDYDDEERQEPPRPNRELVEQILASIRRER